MRLFTTPHTLAGFAHTAPVLNAPLSRRGALCEPMPHIASVGAAANDGRYFNAPVDEKVRILRRDVGDRARVVLSGRMADVCAALERMSRAEAISGAR